MKRQNILLSFVANSFAAKVFVIVKNIILFWFLFIWPIWSHQHSQLRTTRCKRFVRSINFQNLQQKKDPEWLDVKQLLKFAKKCPAIQFAKKLLGQDNLKYKAKLQVVRYDNLQNLQIKSSRTTICIICKKSWPELQFANFTNKLSGMSICLMCQRIARSENLQGLVKNNSLQKPSPGTAIRKQVVRNNNLYNLQNKSSP